METAPLASLTEVAAPPVPKIEVDDLDLALLRALASDARQSQRALARQIEMSPPAVADRLARLERAGAIRGYRAEIDWEVLGLPVVVYLAVTAGPGTELSEIIRAIRELPERCRLVFTLSRHDHLPNAAIAARLGISVSTVEQQMWRALKALRAKLGPYLLVLTLSVALIK